MNKISEIDHERIAMMIRCRMESKDVGPVQLAKYLGCDHSTVSGWLNRPTSRPIPANRINKLAEALELEPRLLNAQAA